MNKPANMNSVSAGIGDNNPPETIQMLLPAQDLKTVTAAEIQELTAAALHELSVYDKVPPKIETDDVYERATTFAGILKDLYDKIEAKRTAYKAPYLEAGRVIDDVFKLEVTNEQRPDAKKGLKNEIDLAIKNIKTRLSDYDTLKLAQQRAAEAKALEELAAKAAQDGIEINPEATAPASGYLSNAKSRHGGAAVRNIVVEWEIVDENAIPRSLLSPDPQKIQDMINSGARAIPGLKLSERVNTHVKRR